MSANGSIELLVLKSLARDRLKAMNELSAYLREGFHHPEWTLQHKEAWIAFNHLLADLPNEIGPHLIGYSLIDGQEPDEVLLVVKDKQNNILNLPAADRPIQHPPQVAEITMRAATLDQRRAVRDQEWVDLESVKQRIDDYLDQWKPQDKEDIRPVVSCLPAFVVRIYAESYGYHVIDFSAAARSEEGNRALTMTLCNGVKSIRFVYYHEVALGEFIGLMKRIHGSSSLSSTVRSEEEKS